MLLQVFKISTCQEIWLFTPLFLDKKIIACVAVLIVSKPDVHGTQTLNTNPEMVCSLCIH